MKRHAILSALGLLFIAEAVTHWSGGKTLHSLYSGWTVNIIYSVFFFIGILSVASLLFFLLQLVKPARLLALACLSIDILYIAFTIILTIVRRMPVLHCILELFVLLAMTLLFAKFYKAHEERK